MQVPPMDWRRRHRLARAGPAGILSGAPIGRRSTDRFDSFGEAKMELFDYIEVFYNEERPHDSLGRVPPLTFLPRPRPVAESPFGHA